MDRDNNEGAVESRGNVARLVDRLELERVAVEFDQLLGAGLEQVEPVAGAGDGPVVGSLHHLFTDELADELDLFAHVVQAAVQGRGRREGMYRGFVVDDGDGAGWDRHRFTSLLFAGHIIEERVEFGKDRREVGALAANLESLACAGFESGPDVAQGVVRAGLGT